MRQRYRRRPERHVTAVQLDLDFASFTYRKWGNEQTSKPGDWLVNNDGDVYTVAKSYFGERYRRLGPGVFEKLGEVWAEQATEDGTVSTLEGQTDYVEGDYLVFDRQAGGHGYAVGTVDRRNVFELLVDTCERILAAERGQWAERQSGYGVEAAAEAE